LFPCFLSLSLFIHSEQHVVHHTHTQACSISAILQSNILFLYNDLCACMHMTMHMGICTHMCINIFLLLIWTHAPATSLNTPLTMEYITTWSHQAIKRCEFMNAEEMAEMCTALFGKWKQEPTRLGSYHECVLSYTPTEK
jgi:hypothetical protein